MKNSLREMLAKALHLQNENHFLEAMQLYREAFILADASEKRHVLAALKACFLTFSGDDYPTLIEILKTFNSENLDQKKGSTRDKEVLMMIAHCYVEQHLIANDKSFLKKACNTFEDIRGKCKLSKLEEIEVGLQHAKCLQYLYDGDLTLARKRIQQIRPACFLPLKMDLKKLYTKAQLGVNHEFKKLPGTLHLKGSGLSHYIYLKLLENHIELLKKQQENGEPVTSEIDLLKETLQRAYQQLPEDYDYDATLKTFPYALSSPDTHGSKRESNVIDEATLQSNPLLRTHKIFSTHMPNLFIFLSLDRSAKTELMINANPAHHLLETDSFHNAAHMDVRTGEVFDYNVLTEHDILNNIYRVIGVIQYELHSDPNMIFRLINALGKGLELTPDVKQALIDVDVTKIPEHERPRLKQKLDAWFRYKMQNIKLMEELNLFDKLYKVLQGKSLPQIEKIKHADLPLVVNYFKYAAAAEKVAIIHPNQEPEKESRETAEINTAKNSKTGSNISSQGPTLFAKPALKIPQVLTEEKRVKTIKQRR